MTAPISPGVGSPIIQTPTLRPTDVVREPGLDQPQDQLPALARLLMAKGQLALEQEKFQNEVAQQKQKKQQLDMLGQTLSGLFQNAGTPEGLQQALQGSVGPMAAAGESVAPIVGQMPGVQQQVTQGATKRALGAVMNDFVGTNVRDPGNQAELLMHLATIDPDAAFRVSEGLKNLQGPENQFSPFLGNDGGIYIINHRTGAVKKAADTGIKSAGNQQVARVAAAQTVQDITDGEALLVKDPNNGKVPIEAAMLEGAKGAGGFMGAIAGGLEPLAKKQYTPGQLQFRRLKLNFIDHYAAAVIGRRASGSPATMKLVLDGFFPAAGEDDPETQKAAAQLRARTKQLLMFLAQGKPVDLSEMPGYANLISDAQAQGVTPTPGVPSPSGAPPVNFNDLLQGVPKP